MGQVEDKRFATAVNLIEQMGAVWTGADESEQLRILTHLKELKKEMTDEQLKALVEYEAAIITRCEQEIKRLKRDIDEAEGEQKRRSKALE